MFKYIGHFFLCYCDTELGFENHVTLLALVRAVCDISNSNMEDLRGLCNQHSLF